MFALLVLLVLVLLLGNESLDLLVVFNITNASWDNLSILPNSADGDSRSRVMFWL